MTHHLTGYLLALGQAQSAAPKGQPNNGLMSMLPIVLMVGVFYMLIIRPQGKKAKEHQRFLTELKKGDDVVTTGGVLGRVTGIKDDELVIQVQEGVRLRILRSAVTGKQKAQADEQKA